MTGGYAIAPDVAWVDGTDGGREESIVWIARLDTAELFELRDAGWLVWVLVADGIGDATAIEAEAAALGATIDFGEEGLRGFLEGLEGHGLIVRE